MAKAKAEEATGRILIESRPDWDAPPEILEAWVVMNTPLPCYPYIGHPAGVVKDVVTRREVRIEKAGVIVPQDQALEILHRHVPAAAKWWTDHGFPKRRGCFFFTGDTYIIATGVDESEMCVFESIAHGRWRLMRV